MRWPARLIGVLTVGYGAAITVWPRLLAKPCGLLEDDGSVSTGVAVLTRGIGLRDVISGGTMAFAGNPSAARTAALIRVTSDAIDAVGFGLALPTAEARRKATLAAGGWGLLTLLAALLRRD